ncbi:helix-turn-helix domain-containing protein [Haladaptatus halobius]|uniref:helix-turn-helix domain-containing protein n=1 Tax=Haladaptatus halobius TaxID=2884875 RepID=UPI001D0BAC2D|nr:helix-turn-helix domain-containing protein [Haladaptatus halobius]
MIDSISGLTDTQRETLLSAVDYGYFEIPRESSLAELATQLGISQNAASERIRCGVKQLVTETLKSDRE